MKFLQRPVLLGNINIFESHVGWHINIKSDFVRIYIVSAYEGFFFLFFLKIQIVFDKKFSVVSVGDQNSIFGDLAVEFGYLSPTQVEELLVLQLNGRPPLGQILVELGALSEAELDPLLEEFWDSAPLLAWMRCSERMCGFLLSLLVY